MGIYAVHQTQIVITICTQVPIPFLRSDWFQD